MLLPVDYEIVTGRSKKHLGFHFFQMVSLRIRVGIFLDSREINGIINDEEANQLAYQGPISAI